jgi:type I restriction enzyme R subunit
MIVCMSRRICVELYKEIVKLRPQWHSDDDEKGALKVVMTGSAADVLDFQPHIRNKPRREKLAERFKDENDPLKLVLVRDMWLTGFDAPCMHTMYADKPMQRHGLMQAIARVNRVFKDKPGGLVVDYLGLADQLKKALADYTESGGKGKPVFDQEEAVAKMLEYFEICSGLFHGFDYSRFKTGKPRERLAVIPPAIEHVLQQDKGKERLLKTVTQLSRAFALSVPHERAIAVRDDVGFFQTVRAAMAKTVTTGGRDEEELNAAVRQIVSRAVASDKVIDIFSAAGLKSPEISILSDHFLAEVKELPQRNLAFEALKKLLNDEIKVRAKKNLVQSRLFSQMLEESIRKYQNRAIETAQILQELIDLAKQMREADKRGEKLGFTTEELAFYDALEVNDSAVKILGDDTLKTIARELVDTVRKNTSIDWTEKESVKAKLRSMVKRILRKHGYPPDKQEKATETVLEQAKLLSRDIAA